MTAIKKIGFIGIGNMGNPMAGHLVRKGFDVTAFDIREAAMHAFVAAHGGKTAATLADAGHGADAVVFSVPDDKVVRQVLFEDKLADALTPGTVVIDMSSSNPAGTLAIGKELAARGISYLDAPVMGGVIFAKDATLDIMVGGETALVERAMPLFNALGRRVFKCGPLGAGHALKSLNNYVNACVLINAIEALTIGKKFGIDTQVMVDAMIAMCTGRNHPLEKKVVAHVLTRKYGTGMAMQFIAKDVKIAVETAQSVGAAVPLGEKTAELWAAACEKLGGTRDQTEIVRFWEEASGVKL